MSDSLQTLPEDGWEKERNLTAEDALSVLCACCCSQSRERWKACMRAPCAAWKPLLPAVEPGVPRLLLCAPEAADSRAAACSTAARTLALMSSASATACTM